LPEVTINRELEIKDEKRKVILVLLFVLGVYPESEFYVPTFRNTLFHLHRSCEGEEKKVVA